MSDPATGGGPFSLNFVFSIFGMILVLGGLVGGKRVKFVSIEFGPITSVWRRVVMIAMGLTILTFVGLMEMGVG